MSNLRDFISGEAELGTESEDGDFDDGAAQTRRKTNGAQRKFDDSSEEDEEDDEEEEARVCQSDFIGLNACYWTMLTLSRLEPILSSTRMKMKTKIGPRAAKRGESVVEKRESRKTSF